MKSAILLSGMLLFSTYTIGQDLVIPDYKGDKESFTKLKNKTIRKEVATFTDAGSAENKSNIVLKEIPLSKFGANYSTVEKDSIIVKLTVGKFVKANHKIKYINQLAVKIDNKAIWGTDGELPKQEINSIYVRIGQDAVQIPKSAYQDLYEPALSWKEVNKKMGTLSVYYSRDGRRFYIAMANSDGAGFYEATFIITTKNISDVF